jgi:hypothetical protein
MNNKSNQSNEKTDDTGIEQALFIESISDINAHNLKVLHGQVRALFSMIHKIENHLARLDNVLLP